jgi:hypothetical protein
VGDKSRISEGFIADNYGFRCDLQFFIDFLRSSVCSRAIQAGRRVIEHVSAQKTQAPKETFSAAAAAAVQAEKKGKTSEEAAAAKKKKKKRQSPRQSETSDEVSRKEEGTIRWEKVAEKPLDLAKKKKKAKTGSIGLKAGAKKKQ